MPRVAFFLAFMTAAGAVAAPVPSPGEREKIEKVWGKVFAPSEKYEFKLDGRFLTIRTAGEPVLRPFPGKPPKIPRTHFKLTGDFVATVRLITMPAPNREANFADGFLATRAGLLVTGGTKEANIHMMQSFDFNEDRKPVEKPHKTLYRYCWNEGHGQGRPFESVDFAKPLYLRLIRKDKVVTAAYSSNGTDWTEQPLVAKLELPDEVSVGVFVTQTTQEVVEATFSGFTVEKPKEEKAKKE